MSISFKLKGVQAMQQRMAKLAKDFDSKRIPKALREEAELVMTDSKQNYVPVDEGVLRSSGAVGRVQKSKGTFKVVLSFGGVASPYALAIHEHLSKYSPPSWKKARVVRFQPAGRGPKYLEKPLVIKSRTLTKDMARRLAV